MILKYPTVLERKGFALFESNKYSFKASFIIHSYPKGNIIFTEVNETAASCSLNGNKEVWKLNGQLENGVPVYSEGIFLTKMDQYCHFFASKELFFGSLDTKLTHSEFPLIGLYEGDFQLDYHEVTIKLSKHLDSETGKDLQNSWGIQQEAATLYITSKIPIRRVDFLEHAIIVCEILSLAIGNTITFHRQKFSTDDGTTLEVWRRRVDFYSDSGSIVYSFDLGDLIKSSLENHFSFKDSSKTAIRRAIDYINSSSHGFMEDKILRVCQAWELLADEFCEKQKDTNEIKLLKVGLKKQIKTWSDEHPDMSKEEISNRVLGSLNWNRLIIQLNNLADSEDLDLKKIDLDLLLVKKMRDQVAHTGRFKDYSERELFHEILKKAVFGLRIIILRKLGYHGHVKFSEDGWATRAPISDFAIAKEAP